MLANVVRKPMSQIFTEFTGVKPKYAQDDAYYGTGDVKYHLGTSYDRPTAIPGQLLPPMELHGRYCLLPWHLQMRIPVPLVCQFPSFALDKKHLGLFANLTASPGVARCCSIRSGTAAVRADKRVHLSLLANPSHLEAVDPIVLGKV